MTEKQLRGAVVAIMDGWVGAVKGDHLHHRIIDTYNSHTPLPRSVRMSYTMDWCAATVSAAGIAAGLTDIMPVECSCNEMIRLYQGLGRWVEDDAYIPRSGDVLFYAWKDDGVGDCKLAANHVGVVETVDAAKGTMTVLEGNMGPGSKVGRRTMKINARYIRGYGIPDYAGKADKPWYAEAMERAGDMGIMANERPEDRVTRAELATVAMRIIDNIRGGKRV